MQEPTPPDQLANWELVVRPDDEFLGAVEPGWLRLLDRAPGCLDVFRSPQWFRVLRADMNPDLALAIGRDDRGEVVALCPLELRAADLSVYGRGRRLWKAEKRLAEVLGGEPLGPIESPEGLTALLRTVQRSWDRCEGIRFCVQAADSPLSAALTATSARAWSMTTTPTTTEPFHVLSVPATFEEYLAQHSSKRRYNFRRELRLLAEGVGPTTLVSVRTPEEVLRADLLVSEAERAADSPEDAEFCRHVRNLLGRRSQLAAAAGLFSTHLLTCGPRVVAVIWGLEFRGDLVLRALSTNAHFRQYSPGSVANYLFLRALTERADSDRPRRIVYGYGGIDASHYRANHQSTHTEHRFLFGGARVRLGERFRGLLRFTVKKSKRVVDCLSK